MARMSAASIRHPRAPGAKRPCRPGSGAPALAALHAAVLLALCALLPALGAAESGATQAAAKRPFAGAPTPEQADFFEKRIRPLLAERCYECHSSGAAKIKGGLLLDSRSGVMKGGDTGPAVAPGDLTASLLIQAVRHADPDLAMPPKQKLNDAEIADLEAWVQSGAPDPRTQDTAATAKAASSIDWVKGRAWWSFHPLAVPAVPATAAASWPQNAIDRFILARLERDGLRPGPDADRRALIRRATYDLIGLPPTTQEVEAFLADGGQEAFAHVVDRLLASPRYGECWGRHWLDVVRYADSAGDNSDFPIPQLHLYRDWVIDAFNRDLPYDKFVREQLAGDLMGGTGEERSRRVIATGYIGNARRFGSRVDDYPQHLTIEDTIGNLGRTFLGLTISCARCHDHKFDPISNRDYYALYGIFSSTRYPWPGIELEQRQRDLMPLVDADQQAAAEAAISARAKEQVRLDGVAKRLKEALGKAADGAKQELARQAGAAEKAAAEHRARPQQFACAYAVGEGAIRGDAALQYKGDPAKPGERVRRHFLTVLGGAELAADDRSSGRLALADWIMDAANPLPARVMANRVWHYHFGRGIVPTPNDFGRQGKAPSHPELLDYLATRLRDGGWSLKALHREIMLSHAYRLSAMRMGDALSQDPGDELLSAFPRRRLDAEALRDTLLMLGGSLDLSPAGAHPFPPQEEWNFTQHNPFKAVYGSDHRSVFLMTQRIQRHPFLAIFDGADPSTSTPVRPTSTTPVQALFLLNDPLVHEQARRFADRLLKAAGDDASRLVIAYSEALSRQPDRDESAAASAFLAGTRERLRGAGIPTEQLDQEAWRAMVRVLFRLNEFAYLD